MAFLSQLSLHPLLPSAGAQSARPRRLRLGLILAMALLTLLLSGCFEYDLGIQFDSQTHGQIVQQIQLSPRVAALGGSSVEQWLADLKGQVRRLGGQVRRADAETLILTVPFGNGADLVKQYRQLFQSDTPTGLAIADLATVPSQLSLRQQNRIFAIRNQLVYDLDLRALPRSALLGSAQDWLDLRFSLRAPWGISQLEAGTPPPTSRGLQSWWPLQPGQLNHIAVVFWVPSPIGLGAAAIGLLVLLGYGLKYGAARRGASGRSGR